MTAVLNERQQLARNLANELGKMDCVWVTSPLPLDDNKKLGVQIADAVKNEVTQILKDWGWELQFVSVWPRVHRGIFDMAACLYEIDLPRPRQPIPQESRIIPKDEVATPKKSDVEMEGMRKYLGLT